MNKVVSTILEGGIGLIALYAVAKVAYKAGQEMKEEELKYRAMADHAKNVSEKKIEDRPPEIVPETEEKTVILPEKHTKPFGIASVLGIGKKIFSAKKGSAVRNFIADPESYKVEAYVENEDIHLKASPNDR